MKKVRETTRNIALWRICAVLIMLCGYLALEFTYVSIYEQMHENTNKFVYENLGVTFMVAYGLLGIAVAQRFKDYWPAMSKIEKKKLDEHQLSLRQRVLERSYKLLGVFTVIALIFFGHTDQRMQTMLWWYALVTLLVLPGLVAAWQKDI